MVSRSVVLKSGSQAGVLQIFVPSPATDLDRKDLALYCETQVRSMIETRS